MTTPKADTRFLGPEVSTIPAERPQRTIISGRTILLRPLEPLDAYDLFQVICGTGSEYLWKYMGDGPFASAQAFQDAITSKGKSEDPFYFAAVDKQTNKVVGYASLMRIDPTNRVIEVGNIMFSPHLQRTTAATECMYLLARYAFEDLMYRRYEWKCNDLNEPSKRAALRLGFSYEGIFRQHMIVKERNRDTAWYSMLDGEWPGVKGAFEAWLDPGNFDGEGKQRHGLAEIRAG